MESAPKIETRDLEDWLRGKNHRRRPRKYKFEFSYVGNDRSFPTVPDFADISENRQTLVLDSPESDFGEKWKVRQKLKHAI